jgi:peptidoglycan hydrolase-like protein with peptidoglycan-binding domain
VTWLPAVGATVRRGRPVLRADEKPVLLLYGRLPMYRQLAEDAEGADVRQLERNLSALGYGGFTVDEKFSKTTTAAVKRWQSDLDLPTTGVVERERVIFLPDAVRVAQWLVRLGAPAAADVLSYTGNTRVVTVAADAAQVGWAVAGARVTVTLPGGKSTAGRVSGVAAEAQAAEGGGEPDTANPGTDGATVAVTIAVSDQKALGRLTAAPVDVRYIARQRVNVLTVPVPALLALAEGGYGLEVVDERGSRIVPVEAGLFADGRVEVTGEGLDAGLLVGVPE